MMTTDSDRRDVARRLREKKAECEERGYPWMCDDLILALGYDHDYEAGDEIFDRLADLIEPVERACYYYDSETNHCGCYDTRLVDLDALLALADEMGAEKNFVLVGDYARRIREALGVTS